MIDYERLEAQFAEAKQCWDAADPFPFCVMDGFLNPATAERIASDFPATMGRINKLPKSHHDVEQKRGVPLLDAMSDSQREFFQQVQSPEFLEFLERLTGISPLYADPHLNGGGLHEIYAGGFLNVHADFNFHPTMGHLRCLNLIVYLNPDWDDAWNGQLELWSEDFSGAPVKVSPQMNRAALFRTSETSWHGHPKPLAAPEGVSRRSLAVYYYTDWPEGLEQRAVTTYMLTPDQKDDLIRELTAAADQIHNEKDAVRLAPRYSPRHVRAVYKELFERS